MMDEPEKEKPIPAPSVTVELELSAEHVELLRLEYSRIGIHDLTEAAGRALRHYIEDFLYVKPEHRKL